ncbi:hypothetical protein B0T21DRAFT_420157 [Apiosordaria backusii]|uniref:Uncharacterized protein n=1 Tax=Apiosordaria backusii TaxID=314023 RepID=A0AA40K732_9PEZI|nr:hypothetical protein B0T21DRAFT_420157 [Apiosordaria backusii]
MCWSQSSSRHFNACFGTDNLFIMGGLSAPKFQLASVSPAGLSQQESCDAACRPEMSMGSPARLFGDVRNDFRDHQLNAKCRAGGKTCGSTSGSWNWPGLPSLSCGTSCSQPPPQIPRITSPFVSRPFLYPHEDENRHFVCPGSSKRQMIDGLLRLRSREPPGAAAADGTLFFGVEELLDHHIRELAGENGVAHGRVHTGLWGRREELSDTKNGDLNVVLATSQVKLSYAEILFKKEIQFTPRRSVNSSQVRVRVDGRLHSLSNNGLDIHMTFRDYHAWLLLLQDVVNLAVQRLNRSCDLYNPVALDVYLLVGEVLQRVGDNMPGCSPEERLNPNAQGSAAGWAVTLAGALATARLIAQVPPRRGGADRLRAVAARRDGNVTTDSHKRASRDW